MKPSRLLSLTALACENKTRHPMHSSIRPTAVRPSSLQRRGLLALILAAAFLTDLANAAGGEKPNVLLILVDDLKPAIGAYGDPVAITPNLDRLAARGTRFDLAYCNQAVCAPSRNNLMTGLRSTTSGLYSLGLNFRHAVPDAVTLPQYFRSHGYHAASLGKVYHIGHGNVNDDASWSIPHHKELVIEYADPASKPDGRLTREEAMFSNYRGDLPVRDLPRGAAWESPDVPDEAYADGRIAAEAARRLRALMTAAHRPHSVSKFTKSP